MLGYEGVIMTSCESLQLQIIWLLNQMTKIYTERDNIITWYGQLAYIIEKY